MMVDNRTGCAVVVDRHIAKNAGTTVRTVFQKNRAVCRYVGYDVSRTWTSRVGFEHKNFAELVQELPRSSTKYWCVEAHVVASSFWDDVAVLQRSDFAQRCRVLVMLRVREPLSWYRSFYDWAILGRQRGGDDRFGSNFTDWLPSNLQSSVLLSATSSRMAVQLAHKPSAERQSSGSWSRLMGIVRSADIVAPLERLDESLIMLRRRSGFLQTALHRNVRPPPMRGPWSKGPQRFIESAAKLCAGGAAESRCRDAVRHAAPIDFRLHAKAVRLFGVQLAPLLADASFRGELAQLRQETHNAIP